jgi:predicted ABC-type ATPase
MSRPPSIGALLGQAKRATNRPIAFVLAGHNGSGKSTLWYERLVSTVQIPLVNADRLTLSILPETDPTTRELPRWAQTLRDKDARWQVLSQEGVRLFRELIMAQRMPFAFETVFSHWRRMPDGRVESKASDIRAMQAAGYFVVLLFVGLVSVEISMGRVAMRRALGGHDVPKKKLLERFPRTQAAVGHASSIADMTVMVDNSRDESCAFSLVRAQLKRRVLFDVRAEPVGFDDELRAVAAPWLDAVAGPWRASRRRPG